MPNSFDIKLSKFLSKILRHTPEDVDLKLDEHGWAKVSELMQKAQSSLKFTLDDLYRVVQQNDKQRFAFDSTKQKIRASQGHSLKVDLGLELLEPPAQLFHGTATRFLHGIYDQGLKPMSRDYVHLSDNYQTATVVGARHGKVIVLAVDAAAMYKAGFQFFKSANGVWLTKHVPVWFLAEALPSS